MKIIWLGHGSFRIEIADEVLLVDPWLTGNPVLPADQHEAAVKGGTHLLLTHAHFDHAADIVRLSHELGVPVVGQYDLMGYWEETEKIKTIGFNKGGTVKLGDVSVSMAPASHSSSYRSEKGLTFAGSEVGFMIKGEGKTIYFSGDTDIMADMDWMADYYNPDIGILSAGGHFTMDMAGATYAANRYFDFDVVIPCHYKTRPALEQNAKFMEQNLKKGRVVEPVLMEALEF